MNKIIILGMLLLLILTSCQNSYETCVEYCIKSKETTGHSWSEAIELYNIAKEECVVECRSVT